MLRRPEEDEDGTSFQGNPRARPLHASVLVDGPVPAGHLGPSRRAEAAIGLWSTLLRGLEARGAALKLDDLILFALREAYLPSSLELKAHQDRLKTLDGQSERVRAELARLRQASQAAYPAKEIAALEDKERRLGRDLDMASMELQTAVQERQQLVTVIGTIGKLLEDTWPPTVRKEG